MIASFFFFVIFGVIIIIIIIIILNNLKASARRRRSFLVCLFTRYCPLLARCSYIPPFGRSFFLTCV